MSDVVFSCEERRSYFLGVPPFYAGLVVKFYLVEPPGYRHVMKVDTVILLLLNFSYLHVTPNDNNKRPINE